MSSNLNFNPTIKNALLWGNFKWHVKSAQDGALGCRQVVHIVMALLEVLPVISQIVSLFEMIVLTYACGRVNPTRPISRKVSSSASAGAFSASANRQRRLSSSEKESFGVVDCRRSSHAALLNPTIELIPGEPHELVDATYNLAFSKNFPYRTFQMDFTGNPWEINGRVGAFPAPTIENYDPNGTIYHPIFVRMRMSPLMARRFFCAENFPRGLEINQAFFMISGLIPNERPPSVPINHLLFDEASAENARLHGNRAERPYMEAMLLTHLNSGIEQLSEEEQRSHRMEVRGPTTQNRGRTEIATIGRWDEVDHLMHDGVMSAAMTFSPILGARVLCFTALFKEIGTQKVIACHHINLSFEFDATDALGDK